MGGREAAPKAPAPVAKPSAGAFIKARKGPFPCIISPTGSLALRCEDGPNTLLTLASRTGRTSRPTKLRPCGRLRHTVHTATNGGVTAQEVYIRASAAALPGKGGSTTAAPNTTEPRGSRRDQLRNGLPPTSSIETQRPLEPRPSRRNMPYILPRKQLPLPRAIATSVTAKIPVDTTRVGSWVPKRTR